MANIVTTDAKPAVDTLLDGFRKPIYDLRSVDTKYEDIYPISGMRNTTVLRYVIPRSKGNYVAEINKLVLALDLKITNKDRTSTPPINIQSGPANNFMFTIFSSLRISYNTTTVLKLNPIHCINIFECN